MKRARAAGLCLLIALVVMPALACSGGEKKSETVPAGSFATAPAGARVTVGAGSVGPLALARDQRLVVRERDGKERQVVRSPANSFPTFPVWSPDGARIAFAQSIVFTGQLNVDWGGDIYVVEAGGGDPKLLWKHDQAGAQVFGLAWTPDGKALLFGYYLTIIKDGKYQGQVQRLERLEIDSGKRTQLVDGAMYPSLSKDGSRLAYMTQDVNGQGGVWVSAADGSGAKQLVELGPQFLAILGPRISPDGSYIAFAAAAGQSGEPGAPSYSGPASATHGLPMDVWRVDVASKAATRVTRLNEDEPYPAWAPDGKLLVIMATGGLYEVAPDGSSVKKVGEGSFGGQVDVK